MHPSFLMWYSASFEGRIDVPTPDFETYICPLLLLVNSMHVLSFCMNNSFVGHF